MSAYGLCPRGEAQIAIAQIGKQAPYEYDLPGGGIEANEDEAAALMREFQEETGLTVWPTRVIGRAGQFWINKGEPRNSLSTFYEVELSATDGAPTEPDHALVWMTAGRGADQNAPRSACLGHHALAARAPQPLIKVRRVWPDLSAFSRSNNVASRTSSGW